VSILNLSKVHNGLHYHVSIVETVRKHIWINHIWSPGEENDFSRGAGLGGLIKPKPVWPVLPTYSNGIMDCSIAFLSSS
jgi:hypothetical protein